MNDALMMNPNIYCFSLIFSFWFRTHNATLYFLYLDFKICEGCRFFFTLAQLIRMNISLRVMQSVPMSCFFLVTLTMCI